MPHRVQWDPDFCVGHELIDSQHRSLLSQCEVLADHCLGAGDEACDLRFDEAFNQLKALVHQHFDTEAQLLAARGFPELEDHQSEFEEFEYLADEVATTDHFDRLELQRFLALWCLGHVTGSAKPLRAFLAGAGASA